MTKKIIHVNSHRVRANKKKGTNDPVIAVKAEGIGYTFYVHEAIIREGDKGKEIAKIVYRPNAPLDCGARVWIETDYFVEMIIDNASLPEMVANDQTGAKDND